MERYRIIKNIVDSAFEICRIGVPPKELTVSTGIPDESDTITTYMFWSPGVKYLSIYYGGNHWIIDRITLQIRAPNNRGPTLDEFYQLVNKAEAYLISRRR